MNPMRSGRKSRFGGGKLADTVSNTINFPFLLVFLLLIVLGSSDYKLQYSCSTRVEFLIIASAVFC